MEAKNNAIGGLGCCAMRQSAAGALDDLIARYRREADRLQALKDALPTLEGDSDAALWQLVMDARR